MPQKAGLAAALLGALTLRLLLVFSLEDKPFFHTPIVDGAAYDKWAVRIATEDFWGDRAFYQDPLYPYALGIFYKVAGRNLLAVRIVQCVIGTLGLWMLFEAARRFLGYRTAIVALILGALYKTLIFFDAALLKDFLAVVAIEAALFFWALDKPWKWAAFGATLGIGALARGNILLIGAAVPVFLLFRREWKPALLSLAGTAMAIAPVTIRNAVVAGDFVLTTAQLGPNLYTGNNPENMTGRYRPPSFVQAAAPEFEEAGFRAEAERLNRRPMKSSDVDAYWRGRALDYISDNFGTFLTTTGKRLLMLLSAHEIADDHDLYFMERFSWVLRLPLLTFGLVVAPLAFAGIYLSWNERGRFALLYLLLGVYALSTIFFFMFARYRLPIVPLLILFAAHAVVKTAQTVHWGMKAIPKTAAAIFAISLLLVNIPLPEAIAGHRDFRTAHYNLGIFYCQNGRFKEAAAEFEDAARLNPKYLDFPNFVWTLAEAQERSGQEEKAFENYGRAATLDPLSPEPLYKLGLIYLRRGMHARADEKFAQARIREEARAKIKP